MDNIGIKAKHIFSNTQFMKIMITYIGYDYVPIIRKTKKYILKFYWEDPDVWEFYSSCMT